MFVRRGAAQGRWAIEVAVAPKSGTEKTGQRRPRGQTQTEKHGNSDEVERAEGRGRPQDEIVRGLRLQPGQRRGTGRDAPRSKDEDAQHRPVNTRRLIERITMFQVVLATRRRRPARIPSGKPSTASPTPRRCSRKRYVTQWILLLKTNNMKKSNTCSCYYIIGQINFVFDTFLSFSDN